MKKFSSLCVVAAAGAALLQPTPSTASTTAAAQPARRSCTDYASVWAPIGGAWSREYRGNCGHLDTATYPKHAVRWFVDSATSGQMCVRAKGYRWRDGAPYWASLGCGTSGWGYVHWGKVGGASVMGVNIVEGKSISTLGVPGWFSN